MFRRRRRLAIFLIAILGFAALGFGWRLLWARPRLNVLLVTLDTTRADHLGCYGYEQALTPTLDALAREGVVFEQAFATVPLTFPSHTSIHTGLYPPENGIHNNGRGKLDAQIPTLAEVLKQRGYDTGAFIGSVVLPARTGLNQGFDTYDDDMAGGDHHGHEAHLMRSARLVVNSALDWLHARESRPFFCWVHLFDPHAPFEGHPEVFHDRFQDRKYDGDIAFADLHIGRLITLLKDRGEYERTLVVVVGDHGEAFGEHAELEHGFMLYNATLRVPLLISVPGQSKKGHRISTSVSQVDIFPTVLDCLNIPLPTRVSGVSLKQAVKGNAMESRPCYSESEACYASFRWAPLHCLTTDSWKYVNTSREELYDLKQDPQELHNLAESRPEQVQEMRMLLETTRDAMVDCPTSDTPIDAKHLQQLRSLGYLASNTAAPAEESGDHLPDVKDMIEYYNAEIEARLRLNSAPIQVVERMQKVVEAAPQFLPARLTLATALQKLERIDEAIDVYVAASASNPTAADPHFELAKLYQVQGENLRAIEQYEVVLKIDPHYATAHFNLATVLMRQGDMENARKHFELGLESFPESTVGLFNFGVFLFQQGELAEAKKRLRRAASLDPSLPQIHYQLGLVLKGLKEFAEAGSQFQETLRLNPRDAHAAEQLNSIEKVR